VTLYGICGNRTHQYSVSAQSTLMADGLFTACLYTVISFHTNTDQIDI
jgi:hypothetical protein